MVTAAATTAGYGYRGGYYHGGYGYRGGYGYPGYYRGGYGYRVHGGYYGWGGGGAAAVGAGVGAAWVLACTSRRCRSITQTYYWGGVPYYYANDVYYTWDPNVNQYVTVAPPAGLQAPAGRRPSRRADRRARHRAHGLPEERPERPSSRRRTSSSVTNGRWARRGFDPTPGAAAAGAANKRNDYMRAQAACLEGRGYSVQ